LNILLLYCYQATNNNRSVSAGYLYNSVAFGEYADISCMHVL